MGRNIHSLSKPLIFLCHRGRWSLSQRSLGRRLETPWTGRQFITGQTDRHTHSHTHNLASRISLNACLWAVGGNPDSLRENKAPKPTRMRKRTELHVASRCFTWLHKWHAYPEVNNHHFQRTPFAPGAFSFTFISITGAIMKIY